MSINTNGLDVLLGDKPKVVCMVGASASEYHPGVPSVPRNLFENLLEYEKATPGAKVIPINPTKKEVLGKTANAISKSICLYLNIQKLQTKKRKH